MYRIRGRHARIMIVVCALVASPFAFASVRLSVSQVVVRSSDPTVPQRFVVCRQLPCTPDTYLRCPQSTSIDRCTIDTSYGRIGAWRRNPYTRNIYSIEGSLQKDVPWHQRRRRRRQRAVGPQSMRRHRPSSLYRQIPLLRQTTLASIPPCVEVRTSSQSSDYPFQRRM